MPKITFIVDHTPAGQAPDRPTYKAGETYDLERSYAEKYKTRGYAVDEVKPERKPREKVATATGGDGESEGAAAGDKTKPAEPGFGRGFLGRG